MNPNLTGPKDHSNRNNWWFVDTRGRKIGYMWPEDMLAVIDSVWGYQQGIKNFAVYAGITRSQVERYCNGKVPIQKAMAMLILNMQELFLERKAQRLAHPWRELPRCESPWLPERKQEDVFTVDPKPFG